MEEAEQFEVHQFLELIDHDLDLFESLLKVFSDDWPGLVASLKAAIDAEDFEGMEKLGHRLKGNLRNFYAHGLANLALELEEAGKSRRLLGLNQVIQDLEVGIQALELELNQVLLSKKTSQP